MRIWDQINPAELTGYVRAALADREENQFTLGRWLPNTPIDDIEYRFTRGGAGLVEAATFRAWDTEAPIGSRPGAVRVTGELPPISRKIRLSEYDRLRQRNAPTDDIRGYIERDAVRMMQAIAARLELARGEALWKAQLQIAENGVVATVDFGRAGGHTVAPGTLWSTVATATPLTDLLAWMDTYRTTNGVNPGAILTSSTNVGYLLRNAEIRNMLSRGLTAPPRVSRAELDALFGDYEIPPIVTYDAQVSVNGVATRVIPVDKLVLLPTADEPLGATLYGTTAEQLELPVLQSLEPGIVATAMTTDDPVSKWTKGAGIGIPILGNPDLTLTADVA